jgi:RecB family exonuclease
VRVRDLRGFRQTIQDLRAEFTAGPSGSPLLIVVPSQSCRRQLQKSWSTSADGTDASVVVTRDELYDRLYERLPDCPRRLTPIERDVLVQASARAAAADLESDVSLRPGLVAEMLRFYDLLRRQSQSVARFEELITEALGGDEIDRGARRMRDQTRFLAATFREYERRVGESGGCDEHGLREHLIADAAQSPIRHVIVTVGDWVADAEGLFVADFDMLARIPGLETLDIVATDHLLGSGFHERLHNWWPGLEEVEITTVQAGRPMLVAPPDSDDQPWWTFRDREEELVAVSRQLKAARRAGESVPLDRTAVVFKRPLPYLYLAGEVFASARIALQTFDALPLAAEPSAAALDLVLDAVASNFTRDAIISLLRSPHFRFAVDDRLPSRESIAALDRGLSKSRYLGEAERLEALATEWSHDEATPALDAAISLVRELRGLLEPAPASEQLGRLLTFWRAHLRQPDADNASSDRERRARAAVGDTIEALVAVHTSFDDPVWTADDMAAAIRRWIEEQTFEVASTGHGVHLIDATAARYLDVDDMTIVGVVEGEWPERTRRNIFYPSSILKALGWPSEKDRQSASDAHFLDLLASARRRVRLSTFTLEDDALVSRSLQLDEVPRAGLSSITSPASNDVRVFVDEALSIDPAVLSALDRDARTWAELRMSRSDASLPRFHGSIDARPERAWSVSALETYVGCPFRFFAQHVLTLEEEPDDEEIMDPRRQGQFVHEVFERFFASWQGSGFREITLANLDAARDLFTTIVDEALEQLPEAEAGLERTRLLGSPAAAGLGEAVIRMEAERPTPVVERLLEHPMNGAFEIATAAGPRTIRLRGKADRLDLLADGTFRVIDYKLGWPPDRRRALQLPIYSVCAEQRLRGHRGRDWKMAEAVYLAFKGPRRVVPLFQNDSDRQRVLADAQERLVTVVDAIERGEFPPTPDDVFRCERCSFATVCRKDYVGDV